MRATFSRKGRRKKALDMILVICPSCSFVAAIAIDIERKSVALARGLVPEKRDGRIAIVTDVGYEMLGRKPRVQTNRADAYGEVVWF